MAKVILSIFLFFCAAACLHAQDVIYTISGNKFLAKVTEVNTTDVKYKDFSNLEGPVYVISKNEVVLIRFSDGSTQIINENPPALTPKTEEQKTAKSHPGATEKKPMNLYYLNKNLISINALALANGDVTLLYDRELLDSRLCLTFLGGYNFNPNTGAFNAVIRNSWPQSKKKYDAGFGISFMPRNTRRVQYFVGLLGKYMSYEYEENAIINNQSVITQKTGSQLAIMINNGWVFRVTPTLNFKLFGAIGIPSYSSPLTESDLRYIPKVYLGYCFGYRF
jgi:hypothetical protein